MALLQVTVQIACQRSVIGSSSKDPACSEMLCVTTSGDEVSLVCRRARAAGACLWGRRRLQRTGTSATLKSL